MGVKPSQLQHPIWKLSICIPRTRYPPILTERLTLVILDARLLVRKAIAYATPLGSTKIPTSELLLIAEISRSSLSIESLYTGVRVYPGDTELTFTEVPPIQPQDKM